MEISVEMEQQINIKFLVKLGKSYQKIDAMLRAVYGNNSLKKTLFSI